MSVSDMPIPPPVPGAIIELNWRECGKVWHNAHTVRFIVERFDKTLTVAKAYPWDKDSVVENLEWDRCSLCHDHQYEKRTWDDGTPVERPEADITYADLMLMSPFAEDRAKADLHYWGVKKLGWPVWYGRSAKNLIFPPNYEPYVPQPGEKVEVIRVEPLFNKQK